MASFAAVLNGIILIAAVFLVLLHPSMERQPGPVHHCHDLPPGQQPLEGRPHHCDDDTDQHPSPTPTPTPAPLLPPTPPPTSAPSPAVDCSGYCYNQCYPLCQANQTAGMAQCQADLVSNGKGCYDSCSNSYCSQSPDMTACLNSVCSFNNCTCDNTYVSNCCQACGQGIYDTYNKCVHYWDLFLGYCIMDCDANCEKNCTTHG